MEKEEALNVFLKNNIAFLTSHGATSKDVKKLRQAFQTDMELRSSAYFTNRNVAEIIVREVTRLKREESPDTIFDMVKSVMFIDKELTEQIIKTIISKNIGQHGSILTKEDFSKFGSKTYLEDLEKKFEDRAMLKVQEEISDEKNKLSTLIAEAEREKELLEIYKSELDELPFVIEFKEEDLIVESKKGIGEVAWWKKLALLGNPFPPEFKGLIGIPEEIYDDVVVRTNFVNSYVAKIENNPEELLGVSIIITGQYGSGKTTILDLVSYKCGERGILPCKIKLMPSPDAGAIINELLRQIGKELGQITANLSGFDKRAEYGNIDSLSKLTPVIDDFKKYDGEGLIIFIDGLHKGTQYFSQTVEFLQQLQTIHEYIVEAGVPCGFLIAGSIFWEKEISGLASIGGSISDIERIPALSEYDAVESVVRRIQSFSPKGKSAPTINKDSVKIAYRTLDERTEDSITFRSFMKHIRDRLKIGNYDEVGIGVSSHFEMIDTIRKFVEASIIGKQFVEIEKEIKTYPNLRIVLCEVLPKIYQLMGVEENDSLFRSYTKVFNLLKNHGLIVKRKSPRKGYFVWTISSNLARVLGEIQDTYAVSPDEALSSIFESRDKVITEETSSVYSLLLSKISDSVISLKDSWPEISGWLDEIKNVLREIEQQMTSGEIEKINVSSLGESCKLLVGCVLKAGGIPIEDIDDCYFKYNSFWLAPDNVDEIVNMCKHPPKKPASQSEAFGILHFHSNLLEQLMDDLLQLTQGEALSRLTRRQLTDEDLRNIHEARTLFINHSYRETVNLINKVLEEKVRDVFYPLLKVIWGENWLEIIPPDIKEKLEQKEVRGHPRAKRPPDINIFYDISRSEYGKILFQRRYRKQIFGEDIRDIDFSSMKDNWELAFSLGDRESHRDRSVYFREHATEIGDVLRILPVICERFLDMVKRMLYSDEFKYEKKSGGRLVGQYIIEGISTSIITIETNDAKRIMKSILSSISRNPRSAIPLDRILIVDGITIDTQIAIINAMIKRGLLEISKTTFLTITDKGKDSLKDLHK